MGMVVRTNIMAINANRQLGMNSNAVTKSLEKLSSGFKINRAGDDASGLAISEKMKAQIQGLETASANSQDGISLVQTAEGALTEVHDMLNRMVELATKSANGTIADAVDRENIQNEVDALLEEIDRIGDSTNFNGIQLLDGSLSATGVGSTSVNVGTISSAKSEGVAGKYTGSVAIAQQTGMAVGDTVEYTVALDDGSSYTVKLTVGADDTGAAKKLLDADGNVVADLATAGQIDVATFDTAITNALSKTKLGELYNITSATGKYTFEAKEAGTATPKVSAMDYTVVKAGAAQTPVAVGVTVDALALDEGREIASTSITEYDGTNYDDAVFTINGKKFVVMAANMDATTDTWMKATQGLGSDVTILIGGQDGLTAADDNFAQNIAKIEEVTGLKVTDAVTEANTNGIDAGAGIRLTAGDGAKGGLTLQIGDTSDAFNKVTVSVGDMRSAGLGIAGLDVSTQDAAGAAIDVIRNAINIVSKTRGDLGALQNRLEHTINNLDVTAENMTSANSRIRDTDMAEEMMEYTKLNVLTQAAQAMLAQANQQPQSILQLLQ